MLQAMTVIQFPAKKGYVNKNNIMKAMRLNVGMVSVKTRYCTHVSVKTRYCTYVRMFWGHPSCDESEKHAQILAPRKLYVE
jgi:hypothetical protein